eukprot:EG_transcript_7732
MGVRRNLLPIAASLVGRQRAAARLPAGRGFATHVQVTHPTFLTSSVFAAAGLAPELVRRLHDGLGIRYLSESQEATLSHILAGHDVVCHAATGTGKTLCYLLPCLHLLLAGYAPTAGRPKPDAVLVLVPTPLLASQVYTVACKLAPPALAVQLAGKAARPLTAAPAVGTLLVAAPHARAALAAAAPHLAEPHVVVLDEADQLLGQQLAKVDAFLAPAKGGSRQLLLFGATPCPPDVLQQMEASYGLQPARVTVDLVSQDAVVPEGITQRVLIAPAHQHLALLLTLLEKQLRSRAGKVIVFAATVEQAAYFARLFRLLLPTVKVQDLHGLLDEAAREKLRAEFQLYSNQLLFTTDIAARGMDFIGVTCVIQLGWPASRLQYIHRVGRTGRRGTPGLGVLLLSPPERPFLAQLQGLALTLSETASQADQALWDARRRVEAALSELAMQPEHMQGLKRGDGYLKTSRRMDPTGVWRSWVKFQGQHLDELEGSLEDVAASAEAFGRGLGLQDPTLRQRAVQLLKAARTKRSNSDNSPT